MIRTALSISAECSRSKLRPTLLDDSLVDVEHVLGLDILSAILLECSKAITNAISG
jgi:hypothetical protein